MSAAIPSTATTPRAMGTVLGVVAVVVLMAVPVIAIGTWTTPPSSNADNLVAAGATAALGVIFRSSARNLMRSTMMTAVRTTSRTVTRRIAKRLIQSLGPLLLPAIANKMGHKQHPGLGLILGLVAIAASFWCVMWVSDPTQVASVTEGHSWLTLSLLAATPLGLHFCLIMGMARHRGIEVSYNTTLNGLLLQGYFTIAGSFLPLSSDAELTGPPHDKSVVAGTVLLGLWGGYWVCLLCSWLGIYLASDLGTMCLIYAFVLAFPLDPLEGADVFAISKWRWFALFMLILITFTACLPESYYAFL